MAVNTRPYQKVGATLKQQLTDGHYVIGDRFPPEREIAAQLNVSRTVVREAIIMLELEELIEVRMGSGTYVLNLPNQLKGKSPKVQFSDVGPFEMLSVLDEMFNFSWGMRKSSAMSKALHSRINTLDYRKEWLIDHEKILSALQRRDSISANNAMWQHLENVKNILFELSDTEDPDFDGYLFSSNPVVHLNQR